MHSTAPESLPTPRAEAPKVPASAGFLSTLQHRRSIAGFTLVEIMIVLAIIAILASIGVPNYLRARKRSQATRIMNDLRLLDSAVEQYAFERSKTGGISVSFSDVRGYLKSGSPLYNSGQDILGNSYGPFVVNSVPQLNSVTFNALSDVAPTTFWSPYY